ncbi:MAG: hypothetical protein QNJ53_18150 [Pleurocapsa sp. MO_192.B19]|nr:hypothetical protein [Pleurocapsa sp. MO_192.B19]
MVVPSIQQEKGSKVARISAFIYGIVCYGIFLGTFLYAVGFLGNLIMPRSIDFAAYITREHPVSANMFFRYTINQRLHCSTHRVYSKMGCSPLR